MLIRMFNTILFLNHLMACLWFLNAKLHNFPASCWVVRQGLIDASNEKTYIVSLYWSFQTMSSVGYGDISASNFSEMLMSILWMIVGIGYQGYAIGNIQSIVEFLDSSKGEEIFKIEVLKKQRETK